MKSRKAGLAALLVVVGGAVAGFTPKPGAEILKRMSSVYNGDLTVLEDSSKGARYLLAQSRQGLVVQGRIDLSHKEALSMAYFQVMALLTALHPKPEHVFNMGLGGGTLSRFHLAHYSKSQVVSAEIDPAVIDLAKEFFFVSDPRHQVLQGDGFELLKSQANKFDVVWVDTITPKEGPKAYIPAKYLNVLTDHVAEGGLVVANLGDSKSPESFEGVQKSYRQKYAHAIRVKTSRLAGDETPEAMLSLIKVGSEELAPELSPSYFVAAGDSASLSCANFWTLYKKWKNSKTVTLDWGSETKDLCTDL